MTLNIFLQRNCPAAEIDFLIIDTIGLNYENRRKIGTKLEYLLIVTNQNSF